MMSKNLPRVVFLPVKDTSSKLHQIYKTVFDHFEKKEHFLLLVPDQTALEFVDSLLWRFPEESFLPHTAADRPCQDLIAITLIPENINSASAIFNLCPAPYFAPRDTVKTIFELEDLTSPQKKLLSQQRFEAYREAGYAISSAG